MVLWGFFLPLSFLQGLSDSSEEHQKCASNKGQYREHFDEIKPKDSADKEKKNTRDQKV